MIDYTSSSFLVGMIAIVFFLLKCLCMCRLSCSKKRVHVYQQTSTIQLQRKQQEERFRHMAVQTVPLELFSVKERQDKTPISARQEEIPPIQSRNDGTKRVPESNEKTKKMVKKTHKKRSYSPPHSGSSDAERSEEARAFRYRYRKKPHKVVCPDLDKGVDNGSSSSSTSSTSSCSGSCPVRKSRYTTTITRQICQSRNFEKQGEPLGNASGDYFVRAEENVPRNFKEVPRKLSKKQEEFLEKLEVSKLYNKDWLQPKANTNCTNDCEKSLVDKTDQNDSKNS